MIADPRDASTWTVLSQATRAELRLLTFLGWLNALRLRGRLSASR